MSETLKLNGGVWRCRVLEGDLRSGLRAGDGSASMKVDRNREDCTLTLVCGGGWGESSGGRAGFLMPPMKGGVFYEDSFDSCDALVIEIDWAHHDYIGLLILPGGAADTRERLMLFRFYKYSSNGGNAVLTQFLREVYTQLNK